MKKILSLIFLFAHLSVLSAQNVKLIYKQTIKGDGTEWRASVIFKPYSDISSLLEVGDAVISLIDINDKRSPIVKKVIFFGEPSLYMQREYIGEEEIVLDYVPKTDSCILARKTPFFFSDIDFDGEDEFLINLYMGGARSSNHYLCYELNPFRPMTNEPFCWGLEDDFVDFYPEKKEIKYWKSIDGAFFYTAYIYKMRNGALKHVETEKGVNKGSNDWVITIEKIKN